MKEKEKKKKLPLDAKLLSDAVIELNISRRSVGLYPKEHPITRQSIESAYALLGKLFELRSSITLGVAKNVLVVDEYSLDRNNPVFIEFAAALHAKGLSAITFYSGLEEKELLSLHKLITDKDLPSGQALTELKECRDLRHIRVIPLDVSKLRFVEDVLKHDKDSQHSVLEDYIYGIMEGTLADADEGGVLLSMPPEDVASIISSRPPDTSEEGYDRFITTYLSKKGRKGLKQASLGRFMTLIENLSPSIKEHFLTRTVRHQVFNQKEAEELLRDLTPEDIERMMKIFQKQSALPESLRNFIDRFSSIKQSGGLKEILRSGGSHIHDIEMNEEMVKLFEEDLYEEFVDEKYQSSLEKMLRAKKTDYSPLKLEAQKATNLEVIDSAFSDVILELASFEHIKRDDHIKLLTRLSGLTEMFLETGRLEEVLHIYNTIYSQMLTGNFRDDTSSMIEYFFRSELFTSKILDAIHLWGRDKREAAVKLVKAFKHNLITPLFVALDEEERSSQRRFYLSVLSQLGKDILPEVLKRFDNKNWYIVRNMIYLIRECGGKEYLRQIRAFTKHKNKKICAEALKTLVHFEIPDALTHLRRFLEGNNLELKEYAIKLCGSYRIKKAVPDLIELLEKKDIFGAGLHHKSLAVQALGRIGDPKALDTLKRLFSLKAGLYKGAFRQLRLEIIRSLEHYPFEQAGPVLELALVSGDNEIKALAQKILSSGWDA